MCINDPYCSINVLNLRPFLMSSCCRDTPGETSVHLDNGTFWSSQVACYTGKPHRAVFEDSLGLIYKNMYRRALSTT